MHTFAPSRHSLVRYNPDPDVKAVEFYITNAENVAERFKVVGGTDIFLWDGANWALQTTKTENPTLFADWVTYFSSRLRAGHDLFKTFPDLLKQDDKEDDKKWYQQSWFLPVTIGVGAVLIGGIAFYAYKAGK